MGDGEASSAARESNLLKVISLVGFASPDKPFCTNSISVKCQFWVETTDELPLCLPEGFDQEDVDVGINLAFFFLADYFLDLVVKENGV